MTQQNDQLDAILQFLYGAAELDGVWFGGVPEGKPRYWWRPKLREAIKSLSALPAGGAPTKQRIAMETVHFKRWDDAPEDSLVVPAGTAKQHVREELITRVEAAPDSIASDAHPQPAIPQGVSERDIPPPEFQEVSWGVDAAMRPVKGLAVSDYAFRQWAADVGITLTDGRALLSAPTDQAAGWQPIETAPKDERILLFVPAFGPWNASWWPGSWAWAREQWAIHTPFSRGGDRALFGVDIPQPTHWQPLPLSPSPQTSEKNGGSNG